MRRNQILKATFLTLSCGALLASATACGPAAQEASEAKIYGGNQVEDGQWPSTVALSRSGRIFCTGTIVHQQLVITAAHCVSGIFNPRSVEVYAGEGSEGGRIRGQHAADSIAISPNYRRKTDGWDDIAYITLQEPIDIAVEDIVPILADPTELSEVIRRGNQVRIVGFGGRNGGGYGVKYETDAPITSFNANEVSIGADGRDSCQGDSGGPAYGQLENGEWRVFGVVSRGGACGYGGIWGRMDANICWIQENSGIDLNLPAGVCDAEEI
ncbi:MAG: S1 family peptidase [Oligoflexus sp.]